jgi:hypothetical protein
MGTKESTALVGCCCTLAEKGNCAKNKYECAILKVIVHREKLNTRITPDLRTFTPKKSNHCANALIIFIYREISLHVKSKKTPVLSCLVTQLGFF